MIFGHADDEAKAAEENHMENTLNSIENDNDKIIKKIDSSNETATTSTEENTTEEVTTKEAPS